MRRVVVAQCLGAQLRPMPSDPNATRTQTSTSLESSGRAGRAIEGSYLAVFERASQCVFSLPVDGEVVLGRGEAADLAIQDASVSRAHAKLVVHGENVQLVDLGSHNGTRISGTRIEGTRRLASGDVIEIGSAVLVYHQPPPLDRPASFHSESFDDFVARLDHEIARAAHTGRLLAVIALVGAHAARLGALDAITTPSQGLSLVMLVERTHAEIEAFIDQTACANLRIGVAIYPEDALSADALVTSAQAAAQDSGALPGRASEAARRVALGDQEVLLADPAMLRIYDLLERLAASDLSVLIEGETGTGKELAAEALHRFSPRRERRFAVLNCAALTETLVESELFGFVRGAFTGAIATKPGVLEVAAGGTVLLDEVGELSPSTQAKLLRALGTKRITRLGDVEERAIDVRVVSATNRDLAADVPTARFRSDLFYRLTGATVWLPPLRHRPRELALLAKSFLHAACARLGRPRLLVSHTAMDLLARHAWPGNVRELKNVMEYCAAAFLDEDRIESEHVASRLSGAHADRARSEPPRSPAPASFRPLEDEIRELERKRIVEALAASDGNQRRAARLLSMPLRTFASKLTQYDLRKARSAGSGSESED